MPGEPRQQETEAPKPSDTLSAEASGTLPSDGFTKDGLNASSVTAQLEAGKMYKVDVTSSAESDIYDHQVKLAWIVPGEEEARKDAAIAAAGEEGTTVVYFVRIGPEGHGVTITDEDLYMYEDDLAVLKELQEACEDPCSGGAPADRRRCPGKCLHPENQYRPQCGPAHELGLSLIHIWRPPGGWPVSGRPGRIRFRLRDGNAWKWGRQ